VKHNNRSSVTQRTIIIGLHLNFEGIAVKRNESVF